MISHLPGRLHQDLRLRDNASLARTRLEAVGHFGNSEGASRVSPDYCLMQHSRKLSPGPTSLHGPNSAINSPRERLIPCGTPPATLSKAKASCLCNGTSPHSPRFILPVAHGLYSARPAASALPSLNPLGVQTKPLCSPTERKMFPHQLAAFDRTQSHGSARVAMSWAVVRTGLTSG